MALLICDPATDRHQKELVQHGTFSFPMACYSDDLAVTRVPWHWHEEWELEVVAEGTVSVLLENARVDLSAGSGIFLNSGVLHAVDHERTREGIVHSLVFHPRLIGGSVGSVFWSELVVPLLGDDAPRYAVLTADDPGQQVILQNIQQVWDAVAIEQEDHKNFVRYLLSKVCRLLCQNCMQVIPPMSVRERIDIERVRAMLTFIEENLSADLTVKKIADSINVSESVCLRCFHRALGTTPLQYVKQSRLNRAAQLLRSTCKTVTTISEESGFRDASYFIKSFREKMGCTPAEYRNR